VQCYKHKIGYLIGKTLESKGEYDDALNKYIESLALYPRHYELRKAIGRVYRLLGNYDKSIDMFKELLLPSPISGDLNFEIAKSYYESGSIKKALEHLKITLDIWENADSEYKIAIEAKKKWKKWNKLN
tara:strand:+ start:498 stop:884 length:387 start_codon:yes stop_codon:yes gene_type:complete